VYNTPDSSSESVAELVMGHLYGMARHLYAANREMPGADAAAFKRLKDAYGKGMELRGRTLGIIGCGRIGQALARLALGAGMHVLPYRRSKDPISLTLTVAGLSPLSVELPIATLDQVLTQSHFISLNLPSNEGDPAILGVKEFSAMRKGVCIVNAARGGAVAEQALLEALDSGQVAHAALDVFEGEPSASPAVLAHPRISLSPHIGAATVEAQARIGTEMAGHLLRHFGLPVLAN
jgi:D-3-phosphoglycerate dehydrogenase